MTKNYNYSVSIAETSLQLDAKMTLKLKDISNAVKIDQATGVGEAYVITVSDYAILTVHNEKSQNPDYTVYMVISPNGEKYVTGSESFWKSFEDIYNTMKAENYADFDIEIYRKESKNYAGKTFITCSIV